MYYNNNLSDIWLQLTIRALHVYVLPGIEMRSGNIEIQMLLSKNSPIGWRRLFLGCRGASLNSTLPSSVELVPLHSSYFPTLFSQARLTLQLKPSIQSTEPYSILSLEFIN